MLMHCNDKKILEYFYDLSLTKKKLLFIHKFIFNLTVIITIKNLNFVILKFNFLHIKYSNNNVLFSFHTFKDLRHCDAVVLYLTGNEWL